jgi:beta-lactamase class A
MTAGLPPPSRTATIQVRHHSNFHSIQFMQSSQQTRRSLLFSAAAAAFLTPFGDSFAATGALRPASLASLEKEFGGRVGVAAIDTGNARTLGHRENERFPMCSTFKLLATSAILARSTTEPGLLQQRLAYAKSELVPYSPVTEKHVGAGMTVAELCAAALQYSDNTAANLLLKTLGGPAAVTAFARSIGDTAFRLDRWEPELNTALAGDERDTTTPLAMAGTLQKLVLADGLPPAQQKTLKDWLIGNTTGATRIRAGVPAGWQVGDKTGTGDYGTTNDVGIVWPPNRAPIVLAVYLTHPDKGAKSRSDVIAAATRFVLGEA